MFIYIREAYAVSRIKITTELLTILLGAGRVRSRWWHIPMAPWTYHPCLCCAGAVRGCVSLRAVPTPPFQPQALVLEAGAESRWTTGVLCSSRAAGRLQGTCLTPSQCWWEPHPLGTGQSLRGEDGLSTFGTLLSLAVWFNWGLRALQWQFVLVRGDAILTFRCSDTKQGVLALSGIVGAFKLSGQELRGNFIES